MQMARVGSRVVRWWFQGANGSKRELLYPKTFSYPDLNPFTSKSFQPRIFEDKNKFDRFISKQTVLIFLKLIFPI